MFDPVRQKEALLSQSGSLTKTSAVLAFDVGGTRIKAGLVRGAEVSGVRVVDLPTQRDVDSVLAALVRLGERVLAGQAVQAIGMSLKGIIDPQQGIILDVNESLSDLIGFPVAQSLSQSFHMPVFIENDARLYTVGELIYGAGSPVENLFCLTLGTGIGCGVALGGRVLRGGRGLFGSMGGHITVQADGPRCTCGNIGCLEALIGTAPLVRHAATLYSERGISAPERMTPQSIFAAASTGDTVAEQVVAYFAHYLGVGIVSLIHTYDPDIVVLGGGIAASSQLFLPTVQRYVDEHTWTFPRGRTRISIAELGDTAALVGASAFARGLDVLM